MNYYEHHLGDYARDAGKLSMLRDGAYFRLMSAYYAREQPLPLDLSACFELTGCTNQAERDAIEYILNRFFQRLDDGFHQKRCDEELARFREKREKAAASANARWSQSGRTANGMRTHSEGNANDMLQHQTSHNGRNALQSPDSSLQSPSKNPTPTPPKGGDVRHRRISPDRAEKDRALEVWNQLVTSGGALPPRDPKLQAAIDAAGGWSRIVQREQGVDAQRVQNAFVEAYRSASA